MAKSVRYRTSPVTFRVTQERLRFLEAIQKLRGDESRSETCNHALDVLFGGYKIKGPSHGDAGGSVANQTDHRSSEAAAGDGTFRPADSPEQKEPPPASADEGSSHHHSEQAPSREGIDT